MVGELLVGEISDVAEMLIHLRLDPLLHSASLRCVSAQSVAQ
jgi:hypothetical protein